MQPCQVEGKGIGIFISCSKSLVGSKGVSIVITIIGNRKERSTTCDRLWYDDTYIGSLITRNVDIAYRAAGRSCDHTRRNSAAIHCKRKVGRRDGIIDLHCRHVGGDVTCGKTCTWLQVDDDLRHGMIECQAMGTALCLIG